MVEGLKVGDSLATGFGPTIEPQIGLHAHHPWDAQTYGHLPTRGVVLYWDYFLIFFAAASCAEFDTTIRLGMRFAISKFKCVWCFVREEWQIPSSFLKKEPSLKHHKVPSILWKSLVSVNFCFFLGKLLMLELVNFTWQEQQFLLLLHVCKMLVEYAVQSSQSQVRGMSVMENRGCDWSGNDATCGCMIVVSYKYLVILRYQLYLADSTNAIQKHPRFYQDLLCMGNLTRYALESGARQSTKKLRPTIRQLPTLMLCVICWAEWWPSAWEDSPDLSMREKRSKDIKRSSFLSVTLQRFDAEMGGSTISRCFSCWTSSKKTNPCEVLVNSKVLCQGLRKAIEDISPMETMKNSCLDSEIMVEIIYNKKSNSKSVKELWTLLLYFFLKSQQFWGEGNNFGKGLWCQLLIFWWVYWKHDGGQETWVSIMIRHGILVIKIHSGRDACSVYSAMNNAYIYIYTLYYTLYPHMIPKRSSGLSTTWGWVG